MASEDLLKKAVADPVLEMAQRILDMRDGKAPPLFPRVEGPHSVTIRYGVWEDDLFALATAALQNNTRPAPAATDTGLETVEYQVRSKLNGHWVKDNFLSQQLSPDTERRELVTRSQAGAIIAELQAKAKDYREYSERLEKRLESEEVTRSQAEELLAAERAEHDNTIATLMNLITDNAAKDAAIAELVHDLNRIKDHETELVNDNAAQAERIKELDRCHEGTIDLCNQKTAQIEALEAKLAAAETFIKLCADGVFVNDPSLRGAARAVLGGKPS